MDPDQQLFRRQVFQAPFDDFPGNPVSFPLYDHRLETFVCHITSTDQYFPRFAPPGQGFRVSGNSFNPKQDDFICLSPCFPLN
jgi:hypothetical protein